MIYLCTVHYQTESWIKPQSAYIKKNIDLPFKVFACVPNFRNEKIFYLETCFEPPTTGNSNHADKLNYLAKLVSQEALPEDIMIFIDGDAFPIRPIIHYINDKLNKYRFIAVQRKENDGDIQPHPCFAATTVGFWNEINGDWSPGFTWKDIYSNDVTDTGGNLLQKLESEKIEWYRMLRSNKKDLHPLWFGIYDDVIYHHGAGYRKPISRLDLNSAKQTYQEYTMSREYRINRVYHNRIFTKIRNGSKNFTFFL